MHEFFMCRSASLAEGHLPHWTDLCQQFFPTAISQSTHDYDMECQRNGIDRKVFLSNGKVIGIDTKVRAKDYGDILLEESSSIEHRTPGWIERPLLTDYIFYLIQPTGKCYVLPFHTLQLAWIQNKEEWKKKYKKVEAVNKGYTTLSWGIPAAEIYLSMAKVGLLYVKRN